MLIPKLVTSLATYDRTQFSNDLLAGVVVGIVALPLAIAFAIASGVTPERGLWTAVVAGLIVAVLGGSRVQIAGPTGAFVVIIAGIVDRYGYNGLALATLMAGVILIIMGLAKFGGMIKFIPYPVTTGFTAGIAVIIFSSQVKELTGMKAMAPSGFIEQWGSYFDNLAAGHLSWWAVGLSLGCLAVVGLLRKFVPKAPGYLIAVVLATVVVAVFQLDRLHGVETIGSRFGLIPRTLPSPSLPAFSGMSTA